MKILIAYASKNGSVRICAERLQKALKGIDITVADLATDRPSLDEYDTVVIGGSIRFGKLLTPVKTFLAENESALLQKRLCLFLCCGLAHEYEYYHERVFSAALRAHVYQDLYFGGSLRTDGLKLFDKLVVRHLRTTITESEIEDGEYTPSMPGLLFENIDRMATYIRRA